MAKAYVTADKLREVLDYKPETGEFFWKISPKSTMRAGSKAGTPSGRYWQIHYKGVGYWAHRLAWLHVTGAWPAAQIDHINRNGLDNRIENLRDVTPSANCRNSQRRNLHGHGVTKNKGATWRAQTDIGGRQVFLGNYTSAAEAEDAFLRARALHASGDQAMLEFASAARLAAAQTVAATKTQLIVDGEIMSVPKAARKLGVPQRTMYYRLKNGAYCNLQTFVT